MKVRILKCSIPGAWYKDRVGDVISVIRSDKKYYWTREDNGFLNIILLGDAEKEETLE